MHLGRRDGERFHWSALDSLIEGFQVISFDWTYLYVNPAAAAHGRRAIPELIGRTMHDAYPGIEETPMFAELRRCMDERVPRSIENLFTFPDGDARWFELRMQPVPEGICVQSVDIHERRQTGAALLRAHELLEAQVAARTAELAATARELEAFSYSVSHDLRAPLRHVIGFAGLLVQQAGPTLDDEGRRHLQTIVEAAGRMNRLIDDLLAFSRRARGPLQKKRTSLDALVREAQAEVAPESDPRDVQWSIPALPEVAADPALLKVVLVNLFSNALKYSRGRTPARIEVTARTEADPAQVVVCVRDNGVGFDMQYADKLFGVFQRLHRAEEFEGTGIGLASVQRIVHRHGGRAWAEGEVGRGAAFYFSLPDA